MDFRFHDIRHDVGTKLLRATGNLKLVQKALGHANLKTTARYALTVRSPRQWSRSQVPTLKSKLN